MCRGLCRPIVDMLAARAGEHELMEYAISTALPEM